MPVQKSKKVEVKKKTTTTRRRTKEHFDVEAIHGEKVEGGKKYYLVKWYGFSIGDSTWEPVENVAHLTDILKAWEEQKTAEERLLAAFPEPIASFNSSERKMEQITVVGKFKELAEKKLPEKKLPKKDLKKGISSGAEIQKVVSRPAAQDGLTKSELLKCIGVVGIIFAALIVAYLQRA